MLTICIIVAIFCALECIRASTLLIASLWLGGVSVAVSVSLYVIGASEIAVIELSVSAGLVMVLLVFAITVLGDSAPPIPRIHASYLWMMGVVALILIFLTFPALQIHSTSDDSQLAAILWHDRSLDVVLQIALLFAGALTVLSLLKKPHSEAAEPGGESTEIEEDTMPDLPLIVSEPNTNLEKEMV